MPGVYGPCIPFVLHPHHLQTRGAGGDDDLTNLITLCPAHHDLVHTGVIPLEVLQSIMTKLYGYPYDE